MARLPDWKRYPEQEDKENCYRWFETKRGDVASFVRGYCPGEANLRLTTRRKAIEVRGHQSVLLSKTDNELRQMINLHYRRSKL